MAGHASTVDDPEKHFLGNLLDEDPCYNSPQLNQGSSSSPGAIPPVSVISEVGPISTNGLLRSYWPEPPPPYSPPVQTQWYGNESQQYLRTPASDFVFSSGRPAFITQPQIHHHHHNLHHHTHTHNVVENHHHYPVTVRVNSQCFGVNVLSETSPSYNSNKNDDPICDPDDAGKVDAHSEDKKEVLVSNSKVSENKQPPSYRDVAARSDQCAGADGVSLSQAKKQPQSDLEARSYTVKPRDAANFESSKSSHGNRDRKHKSIPAAEFQKITRKKVVVKKEKVQVTGSPSLPLLEKASAVDTPTKYEVLQNLSSKTANTAPSVESALVAKVEREPMRDVTVIDEGLRSGSVVPGSGPGTVIEVVTRAKRAIEGVEKKKQTTGTSLNAAQLRRRTTRKRCESGWMEKTAVVIARLSCWVEFVFKWMLNLVGDVCLQVYDIASYSTAWLLESIHSLMKRVLLSIHASFIAALSSLRQADMRRLLRFRGQESLIWGLEENITLPATGEEALERFLRVPSCQDAYGVLGLKASCTEEDVRRHYKRLSALLDPVKNMIEGAEEAYLLVNKAYQAVSTPEARKMYNFSRIHPSKNDLHHEIGELWERIRERVEKARNSMHCDCGRRHTRIALDIRQSEARYCRRCKTRHPARANDIWVETRLFGLLWVYFTCRNGVVYDITNWATCEVNYLKHVRPNSHTVQYRLVSPPRNANDVASQKHSNEKLRDLADVADEFRMDWGRSGHAQVSYLPLEPRSEDRSRRAANRRQKKWR